MRAMTHMVRGVVHTYSERRGAHIWGEERRTHMERGEAHQGFGGET
jgi:hypothetical protein